jgi:hypothetical protein
VSAATSSRAVAVLPKNSREEVRVTVDEFHGHRLVNVRVWFIAEDGTLRPGKQGIAVRLDMAADLARAIAEAAR